MLARALESAGIEPGAIYVTNAVKHFKWRPRGKRRLHQTPRAGEVEACKLWLEAELEAGPRDRGRLIESPLAPLAALTIHPSAILRLRDHEEREEAIGGLAEDLRLVRRAASGG